MDFRLIILNILMIACSTPGVYSQGNEQKNQANDSIEYKFSIVPKIFALTVGTGNFKLSLDEQFPDIDGNNIGYWSNYTFKGNVYSIGAYAQTKAKFFLRLGSVYSRGNNTAFMKRYYRDGRVKFGSSDGTFSNDTLIFRNSNPITINVVKVILGTGVYLYKKKLYGFIGFAPVRVFANPDFLNPVLPKSFSPAPTYFELGYDHKEFSIGASYHKRTLSQFMFFIGYRFGPGVKSIKRN